MKMSIHSRGSLKNPTLFHTKMGKVRTHKFYPRWSVSHSSLAIFRSHVEIYLLYRGIFYVYVLDFVQYNEDFVKSRFVESRFFSKHFSVILAVLKKIVRYTEDFVI